MLASTLQPFDWLCQWLRRVYTSYFRIITGRSYNYKTSRLSAWSTEGLRAKNAGFSFPMRGIF